MLFRSRGESGDLEIGTALRTTQLVALVDVELVDLDLGVALRAGGHTLLRGPVTVARFGNCVDDVPESRRQTDLRKFLDYSTDNLGDGQHSGLRQNRCHRG